MARKVFPSSPNVNDIFTSTKGKKFQWNGKVWKRTQDTNVESMTLDSSADEKLALHGSDNPTIRFREGSTDKGNLHWKASTGEMRLVNEESSQELRLGSAGVTVTGNLDVTGNLEVTGTTTFNGGTLTLGDSATDNVVFGADVNSSITPNTDNAYDLGSSSKEWRNLYIDGEANIDTLNADSATLTTADINGGTLDNVRIGSSTPSSATFTTLVATGNVDLGDATSDTITATGRFDSALVPSADGTYDLGSSSLEWNDLYIDGTANIDTLRADSATLTTVDINGGSIDGAGIGANSASSGAFTTLSASGNVDLGDATSDTITATGRFDSVLVPSADSTYALGTTALRWSNLFIDAATVTDNVSIGGNLEVIGNANITGTLTYEDVTNIDSVGIVTARSGLVVSSGGANITGGITGDLTGDVTGNADTATTLATARTIGGVSFNGSANINLPGVNATGNQDTTGNAATASQIYADQNGSATGNHYVVFVNGADSNRGARVDSSLRYQPSSNTLSGGTFEGDVTGDLTGDVTGNADTATTLATSRTLSISSDATGSASFNGGANADIAVTLANSGVTAGTYGSSSAIPAITVDAKGRITSATTSAIDSTSVSNGGESVSVSSGGQITSSANHDFDAGIDVTGNITVTGTVDGRDVASDGSKLDGIESGATADQTAAEIRSLVESASDSNVFTDADHSKLNGIAAGAEVNVATDLSVSETTTAVTISSSTGTNGIIAQATASTAGVMAVAQHNKLAGIEAGATNVTNNNQLTNGAGYITSFDITTQTDNKYLRSDAADNCAGDITFDGGAGAVTIANNSDIRFQTGTWTGEVGSNTGKIQYHSNHFYFQSQSSWHFRNGSGTNRVSIDSSGNISANGTVTASSDIKLKKNISTIDNALDKVNLLRGVEFDYIENGNHNIGVIAQEVESVLPDLVHTNEETDTKSVAYSNLTAVLIEAVKELTAEVNTLKAELNTLKGE